MKKTKFIAFLLSATLVFSGCGNMNNTTKGGLIGGGCYYRRYCRTRQRCCYRCCRWCCRWYGCRCFDWQENG